MEQVYTTSYAVTALHTDCFGRCKPSSLLRFAQDAAEAHCIQLGADWDTMAKKNYFWAVIRQKIEITRLPETGETVTVKTWPIPTFRCSQMGLRKKLMQVEDRPMAIITKNAAMAGR